MNLYLRETDASTQDSNSTVASFYRAKPMLIGYCAVLLGYCTVSITKLHGLLQCTSYCALI